MRILAKVSYKGTNYQGWQKQINAPTIEEEIEKVLSKILNTPTNIYGSGRTDAGVHAVNQTFHFDVSKDIDLGKLKYSANCLLPKDIYIKNMEIVDESFHARYSAKKKIYQYIIHFNTRDVFNNDLKATILEKCDIDILKKSLLLFKGEHNYSNFTSKEEDENNFVRTIYQIDTKYDESKEDLIITLEGNGFMRYMIRFIVGTCIAISQNKEDISFIKDRLDSKEERNIVSYKAPSEGLYLLDVIY